MVCSCINKDQKGGTPNLNHNNITSSFMPQKDGFLNLNSTNSIVLVENIIIILSIKKTLVYFFHKIIIYILMDDLGEMTTDQIVSAVDAFVKEQLVEQEKERTMD